MGKPLVGSAVKTVSIVLENMMIINDDRGSSSGSSNDDLIDEPLSTIHGPMTMFTLEEEEEDQPLQTESDLLEHPRVQTQQPKRSAAAQYHTSRNSHGKIDSLSLL